MNVGKDTTLGDGDVTEKLVQLLVVADGELKVARDNTGLLVVAGSVTGQLEDLSSEVLKDGSEVDGGTGTDTLGIVTLAEKTVDTADGECETGLGRAAEKKLARCSIRNASGNPILQPEGFEEPFGKKEPQIRKAQIACRVSRGWESLRETYDWAFLPLLALPPDLPPPVILNVFLVGKSWGKRM